MAETTNCAWQPVDSPRHKGPCLRGDDLIQASDGKYYCIFHYPKDDPLWNPDGESQIQWFINEFDDRNHWAQKDNIDSRNDLRATQFPKEFNVSRLKQKRLVGLDLFQVRFLCVFNAQVFQMSSCDFSESIWEQHVHVSSPDIATCDFSRARFLSDFEFGSDGGMTNCTFSHTTWMRGSKFDGIQFHTISFADAKFIELATFVGCRFDGHANFSNTKFLRGGDFQESQFQNSSQFDNADFDGLEEQGEGSDFHRCRFAGDSSWHKARFHGRLLLDGTKFDRVSDYSEVEFAYAPELIGTIFDEEVHFEGCVFRHGKENTYRKLKRKMEEQHHYWEATRFYALELGEQRKRGGWREPLNCLYYGVSGYGTRWWQPLCWVLILGVLFGFLYWGFCGVEIPDPSKLQPWERQLVEGSEGWRATLYSLQNLKFTWLLGGNALVPRSLGIWLLSGVQSIVSIILIAMAIIHVRRRFRIQ